MADPEVGLIRSSSRRIVVDLPAPFGPEEPENLAAPDVEVEVEEPVPLAVVLRQARDPDRELVARDSGSSGHSVVVHGGAGVGCSEQEVSRIGVRAAASG